MGKRDFSKYDIFCNYVIAQFLYNELCRAPYFLSNRAIWKIPLRSLKRNLEMQIYSKSENTNRVLHSGIQKHYF